MERVEIGSHEHTEVFATDKPGFGGACHEYSVQEAAVPINRTKASFARISFQKGPIKEYGVNGIHQEDLLAIVIHRLLGFQSGDFKCRQNSLALTKIEEALFWLRHRTNDRKQRGVEGTDVK